MHCIFRRSKLAYALTTFVTFHKPASFCFNNFTRK